MSFLINIKTHTHTSVQAHPIVIDLEHSNLEEATASLTLFFGGLRSPARDPYELRIKNGCRLKVLDPFNKRVPDGGWGSDFRLWTHMPTLPNPFTTLNVTLSWVAERPVWMHGKVGKRKLFYPVKCIFYCGIYFYLCYQKKKKKIHFLD